MMIIVARSYNYIYTGPYVWYIKTKLTSWSIACWASRSKALVLFRSCLYLLPELLSFKCSSCWRRSISLRSDSFLALTACDTSWCSSSSWASSCFICGKTKQIINTWCRINLKACLPQGTSDMIGRMYHCHSGVWKLVLTSQFLYIYFIDEIFLSAEKNRGPGATCRAIFSLFNNISWPNFVILLILRCSF